VDPTPRPTGPDLVALHDQVHAETKQKARIIGAYYATLLAEGVAEWEATKLALDFQKRFLFPEQVPEDPE
jgi:hypothetical protein